MTMLRTFLIGLLAAGPASALAHAPVAIPGADGTQDYTTVDPATNRLFVAHGDTVGTVDLGRPSAVTTLALAHHAHAVLPIPVSRERLLTDSDIPTAGLITLPPAPCGQRSRPNRSRLRRPGTRG